MSEWQKFAALLDEENRLLRELGTAALALGDALVAGEPSDIQAAERRLEAQRLLHAGAYGRRVAMQRRGFGTLNIRQVCAYAPTPLRRRLYGAAHELTTSTLALKFTISNNKSLILAGLERLAKIVKLLQRAGVEQTGTYLRRGIVPPPQGSVIVSRRA